MSKQHIEQFHSMYTNWWVRKVFRNHIHRNVYKHWNNWYCKGGNGLYCFEKGYDEDYAKNKYKELEENE